MAKFSSEPVAWLSVKDQVGRGIGVGMNVGRTPKTLLILSSVSTSPGVPAAATRASFSRIKWSANRAARLRSWTIAIVMTSGALVKLPDIRHQIDLMLAFASAKSLIVSLAEFGNVEERHNVVDDLFVGGIWFSILLGV